MKLWLIHSLTKNIDPHRLPYFDKSLELLGSCDITTFESVDFQSLKPDAVIIDLLGISLDKQLLQKIFTKASAPILCISPSDLSGLAPEDYFYTILFEPVLLPEFKLHLRLLRQRYDFYSDTLRTTHEWMQIFNSIPDALFVVDVNHTILRANLAFSKIYEVDLKDVIGRKCYEFLHKSLCSPINDCPLIRSLSTHNPTEEAVVFDDTVNKWYHVSVFALSDTDGNRKAFIHYCRDITKRKQVEAGLKSSEAMLNAIVQTREHSIWAVDRNHKLIMFNDFYKYRCKLRFGIDIYVGLNQLEYLTNTDYRYKLEVAYAKAFAGRSQQLEYSYKLFDAEIFIEAIITPIVIDDEIIGASVFAFDVTDKKILQDGLIESENKFKSIFKQSSALMWIIDIQTGCIVDANLSASAFYGYSISELIGMHLSKISLDAKELTISQSQTKQIYYHSKHRLADGTVKDMEVYATELVIKGNRLLFCILHDITDKLKFQEELNVINHQLALKVQEEVSKRRAQEQLLIQQSKMASMGEMLAVIAHQWKQPLNALSLIIQSLYDEFSSGMLDREFFEEMTKKALQQITYMTNTVEDFRQFLKPSKTKQPFDVKTAVCAVIDLMSGHFFKSDIDIVISDDEGRGFEEICLYGDQNKALTVLGYENEFKQAVIAILQNAKDAIVLSKQNGTFKHQRGLIKVSFSVQDCKTVVKISDNAGGIPEDIIDKVFDYYFTTKGDDKGTGIGLYMAKTIIETNMNGSLRAYNDEDGAVFEIIL